MLAPLLPLATSPPGVAARARSLVHAARAAHRPGADVTDFLAEYGLGTAEGVALLCLAEALLRIPDAATADALIEDRIAGADWQRHIGHGDSLAVNASAWAFMLTGRVLALDNLGDVISSVIRRLGEPVIRTALRRGVRMLARQFVMGRTIDEALARADRRLRYSFDMLGEAAKTHADAERYRLAYLDAIGAIGRSAAGRGPIAGPGISVKLSALHPRYEPLQAARCVPALISTLTDLALAAKAADIGLTVDAEEADRLEISLDIFAAVLADPRLAGWDGLGLAVQGYQKRALPLDRLDRRPGPAHAPSHSDAAGEGRLLGQRDQAGAGAGPCRLSGVHPQGRDRCELARLRAPHAGVSRRDLPRVRHPQRA